MFESTVHGIAHLLPETTSRHNRLAREKLAVQPRRSRSVDLLLQGEIRSDGQREPFPALGVLIAARLNDRAGRGVTCQFKVSELKMVRSAVDPFNDGIGRAFQLVMQTTLYQAAKHGVTGVVAVESKARNVGLAAGPCHGPVHRLDDVSTNPEIAQRWLKARLQRPAGRGDTFGKAEPLELDSPAE